MSAIPGQTVESWAQTLEKVMDLKPDHISAYSLILEEGTPFFSLYGKAGGEAQTVDDNTKLRKGQIPSEDRGKRNVSYYPEIVKL